MISVLTAAKHAGVSAFKAQSRSVGSDVRTALVNNPDHAERNAGFGNDKPVW